MSVILCGEQLVTGVTLVVGCRHRHPVADGIAADDSAAGVYARSAHRALKHLGIFYGVGELLVTACLGVTQLRHTLYGVGQVHLQTVGQLVGDGLAESVGDRQFQLLHTRHILYRVFRCHGAIGDDVRHLVVTILVLHPFEHTSATIVIKVGVDIRERDTVWVKETFEQQVIFHRVDLRDAQTVGHHRAGGRATSRAYHHAQLVPCRVDKVLHDKEVAWETHGLHDVQLKLNAVGHILGYGVAIKSLGSVIGKLRQIVGLKLYAVQLVDATQVLDLLVRLLLGQRVLAVLIGRKLAVEILWRVGAAGVFLRSKLSRDGEERHYLRTEWSW